MKIIKLKAVNIQKLKDITIEPENDFIVLTGKNGSGKSSILEAIQWTLTGKRSIPDKPIRNGEDKGQIELDLGDIKVKRTFTQKDSYLSIEANKPGLGQEYLDKIAKSIYLDPSEFIKADPKKHKELMLVNAGLYDKYLAIKEKYLKAYDNRRHEKRLLKDLSAQVTDDMLDLDDPGEVVRLQILAEKLSKANLYNQKILNTDKEIIRIERTISDRKEEIKKIELRIEKDHEELSQKKEFLESARVKQIEPIQEEINQAEEHNLKVANWDKVEKFRKQKSAVDDWEQQIENIESQRDILFDEIDYPLEGLKFDEDGLKYYDIPFGQLSDGEKLRIAMSIIIKESDGLKVIRVRHGAFLDEDSIKIIHEMSEEHGFQIWMETVYGTEEGITYQVQDGEIV